VDKSNKAWTTFSHYYMTHLGLNRRPKVQNFKKKLFYFVLDILIPFSSTLIAISI
jgi:hypothetical protein